jgi:hypothetical protein
MAKTTKDDTAVPETKAPAAPRLRPVQIPVQTLSGVLEPQWQEAVNAEHWFYNQGQNVTWLCVDNGSDAAVTLTFIEHHPDFNPVPVEVRAQTVAHVGPLAARDYNDILNRVTFALSSAEGVRLAVERLGI